MRQGAGAPPSGATRPTGARAAGGMGGGSLSSEAIAYLQAHQGSAKYLLAAVGSQTTAQIIIDTGEPVVTIGGFNGQDPAPTVSQLAKLVADGELKYVLLSGSSGGGPGGGGSSADHDLGARRTAPRSTASPSARGRSTRSAGLVRSRRRWRPRARVPPSR